MTRWAISIALVGVVGFVGSGVPIDASTIASERYGSPVGTILLVGLLGLTAQEGLGNPLDRVTECVRRLAAGEYEVDVPTDRDDEIGRLSAAVEELADTLQDRERNRNESERYRKALYRIASDSETDEEETIRRLLELGRDRLDVEAGLVSRIDVDTARYEIRQAIGGDLVEVGPQTDLSEIYCERTIESEEVLGIHNAPAEGWADHPAYDELGISCYLGGNLLVEDELYGTLCFVREAPHGEPFSHEEKAFVNLMARWVSHVLERREHERELRRKTRAMDAAPIGITMTGPPAEDEPIVYVNEAFQELTGYSTNEVLGRNPRFLQGDRTRDEPVTRLRTAIEADEPTTVELRNYRADGTEFWNRVSIAPVTGDDGEVTNYVGFQEDVTERKDVERELRRERDRFESLVREVDEYAIFLLDPEGHVRSWNAGAERIKGYDADEILGEHFSTFYLEGDRVAGVPEQNLEIASEAGSVENEGWRVRKDGSRFWANVTITALTDEDGRLTGFAKITRDMTERKARERELRETKRRLELALEGTNTGVWEWTVDSEALTWNETLADLLGLETDPFEGTFDAFTERVHPDDVAAVTAAIESALETEELYRTEFRMRHEDGSWRWFAARGRVVSDGTGETRMVGILNDITERKERERELRRYREYTDDILDAIDDVFYVVDEDCSLKRWNESLVEVTGYTDDEIAEMNAVDFLVEDERARVAAAIEAGIETGSVRIESEFRTKDGDRVPYEFVAALIGDLDGNRVWAGTGRNISERRERERELSRLIDNVPGFVYRAENAPAWPTVFVSEGVHDIAGYEPETLMDGEVEWGEDVIVEENERVWNEVQAALEERAPFNVTYPIETASGERRWVKEQGRGVYAADGSLEALEGVVIDITDQVAYERELERARHLLEQSQRLADVGAWEIDVGDEPPALEWSETVYDLFGVPPGETLEPEDVLEFFHPEDREERRSTIERAVETGEGWDEESRIRTANGDERWIRTIGEPVIEDGEVVKLRGTVQDITEQKDREFALESLHDTTRRLLGTKTAADVADLVADAADDVLSVTGVGIYLLDTESNRLEPTATTPGYDELCDGEPSAAGSDTALWAAFVEGDETAVDGTVPFEADVDEALAVPIGTYGVLVVGAPPPTIDDADRQLLRTLVATSEAAFDRIESEASLRERDAELEAQNRRLRRQIQINDIIRRIDQSLIGVDDRDEIERTVCEQLVESDDVACAWIGTDDASATRLKPRSWAGPGDGYLDSIDLTLDGSGTEPALTTTRSESPTVVSNVLDDVQTESWRRFALGHDFHSVVSVPLTFDEYFYGVLTVYGNEPDAFGDLERTVFAELGETIANSINAVETRQALYADTAIELTLRFDDSDDFLARLAREAGARIEYEGLAAHADDTARLFFTTDGKSADVESVLDDLTAVTDYHVVSQSAEAALFEAVVTGDPVVSRLVRHGGTPQSIRTTEDGLEVVVDIPATTDVRAFVEMLEDRHPSAELVGKRDVDRETAPEQRVATSLLTALTDRQREVLRTAYFAGFFEWPRESTGEEVAEMLDISQPTVNHHLRRGQQQLFQRLFDGSSIAAGD